MKVFVTEKYGGPEVLKMKEIEIPTMKENEVLIKLKATSLNYGNIALLRGEPFVARFAFGLRKPKFKIPGVDMSGIVEAVGANVKDFKVGDEVFGELSRCGFGSFAEYVAVPEEFLALKPSNFTFEEAASLPMSTLTALQALRTKGKVKEGDKVLIYGASGGVGSYAVQLAKALGGKVTALCSTSKVSFVKALGADEVIDYKEEDFTKRTETYDVIIGVNGYQPISVYKKALKEGGRYVMVGGSGKQMSEAFMYGPMYSAISSKSLGNLMQKSNQEDLLFIKQLAEEGKIKPVIDRQFTFEETKEAFQYYEKGHVAGKVVVTMNGE